MILSYMLKKLRKEVREEKKKLVAIVWQVSTIFKSETLAEVGRVKYKDLEDMVWRMELTYNEIVDILDIKYNAGSTIGYTLYQDFIS